MPSPRVTQEEEDLHLLYLWRNRAQLQEVWSEGSSIGGDQEEDYQEV